MIPQRGTAKNSYLAEKFTSISPVKKKNRFKRCILKRLFSCPGGIVSTPFSLVSADQNDLFRSSIQFLSQLQKLPEQWRRYQKSYHQ